MTVDLLVRNARVVTHEGEFTGGVAVADGRIARREERPALVRSAS